MSLNNARVWQIATIGLAIILLLILLSDGCGGRAKPSVTIKRDTVWAHDTEVVIRERYKPVIRWRDSIQYVTEEVDTAYILRDYYTAKYFADTLVNDTSMFVAVWDSIYFNDIQARGYAVQNRRPTQIINEVTINQPPRKEAIVKLYLGAFGTFPLGGGPFASLTTRGGAYIGYGYNLRNVHELRAGWMIRFRPLKRADNSR
jgi:hypothetical protein